MIPSDASMKILVADDDAVTRKVLERQLASWGYRPILCKSGTEAWRILRRENIPLAVLDWMMPGIQGPELVRKIRGLKNSGYTYLILLSSRSERRDLLTGLSSGADDYLTKPLHSSELRVRLQTGERILRLEKNLIQAKRKLQKMAYSDSVTGLWNRHRIMEFLREEWIRSQRQGQSLGIILLDIDHFKAVNDRHGHPAGDGVLIELARRLRKETRPYDRIGRIGGDEVMILVPGCGRREVLGPAERMREAVASKPFKAEGEKIPVTVSLGAAASEDFVRGKRSSFIQAADRALYRAKRKGRNVTVVHKLIKGR